jgi:homeobox protein cut-like
MDTHSSFVAQEAVRAFQALNPVEKAVLSLTKVILGNRRARAAFVLYAMALHALVMFTTYECTLSSGSSYRTEPVQY